MAANDHDRPVVIIGGGIGGLSTAVRLAAASVPVSVYEKNAEVGGKMGQLLDNGFRWDTGPSVITMRHVLRDLFEQAGRTMEDYLKLVPLEPLTRYFYSDGKTLDVTADWPSMAAQIADLDPRDTEGYLNFLAYASALHRITGPVFIYDRPPTWRSFLRVSPLDILRVRPWVTVHGSIRRRVRSPHLRQMLSRFATYVGSNPYEAPSVLDVIADVELSGGVHYPSGGIYQVAAALRALAEDMGVEIHTGTEVTGLVCDGSTIAAVELEDGSRVQAKAVVANADVATVYANLLQGVPGVAKSLDKLKRMETSCSGFVMMLGIDRSFPQLAHHNIFFSRDYRREFDEIFGQGRPPSDPTVYVSITSKSDPSDAPRGCENWFVLVNAPALNNAFDWTVETQAYRDHVLDVLAGYGFDVRKSICCEHLITPEDLARRTGAWRGALYGISSNHALNALRRPHNRSSAVRGLFFAGGTTHPGGGVPMVTLSGNVAAGMVLEYLA